MSLTDKEIKLVTDIAYQDLEYFIQEKDNNIANQVWCFTRVTISL